jgi:septum formation topological specificity factor MinE
MPPGQQIAEDRLQVWIAKQRQGVERRHGLRTNDHGDGA